MMETKSKQGRSNYISSCELEGGKAHNSSPPPKFHFYDSDGRAVLAAEPPRLCQTQLASTVPEESPSRSASQLLHKELTRACCQRANYTLDFLAGLIFGHTARQAFFFFLFFFSLQANLPSTKLVSWIQRGETENNLYLNQGGDVVFLRRSVGELKRGPLTRRH